MIRQLLDHDSWVDRKPTADLGKDIDRLTMKKTLVFDSCKSVDDSHRQLSNNMSHHQSVHLELFFIVAVVLSGSFIDCKRDRRENPMILLD